MSATVSSLEAAIDMSRQVGAIEVKRTQTIGEVATTTIRRQSSIIEGDSKVAQLASNVVALIAKIGKSFPRRVE